MRWPAHSQSLGIRTGPRLFCAKDHVLDERSARLGPHPRWRQSKIAAEKRGRGNAAEGYDLKRIMRTGHVAPSTIATGSCATSPSWCNRLSRRAQSRWTWRVRHCRQQATAFACPTALALCLRQAFARRAEAAAWRPISYNNPSGAPFNDRIPPGKQLRTSRWSGFQPKLRSFDRDRPSSKRNQRGKMQNS